MASKSRIQDLSTVLVKKMLLFVHGSITEKLEKKNPHILSRKEKDLGRSKELHWAELKAEQDLGAAATCHVQ